MKLHSLNKIHLFFFLFCYVFSVLSLLYPFCFRLFFHLPFLSVSHEITLFAVFVGGVQRKHIHTHSHMCHLYMNSSVLFVYISPASFCLLLFFFYFIIFCCCFLCMWCFFSFCFKGKKCLYRDGLITLAHTKLWISLLYFPILFTAVQTNQLASGYTNECGELPSCTL